MCYCSIHGGTYTYLVQRQKRKNLQLRLTAPYTISIKVPINFPCMEIYAFLCEKADWIHAKNRLLQDAQAESISTHLKNGSVLPFRGSALALDIKKTFCKPTVKLDNHRLCVNLYLTDAGQLSELLKKWYVKQATKVLVEKTDFWCAKLGVQVNRIAIKEQKTRWGSCSSRGNINYNWRIMMSPESTIDYLVIHEVAHRIHLNHSDDFWALVGRHCPEYQAHRLWLKQYGQQLFKIL